MTKIDHLVVGAANLSAGVEYVNRLLGVDIPYGGEHEKMGTHNHIMQLGSRLFLEVIAINPQALNLIDAGGMGWTIQIYNQKLKSSQDYSPGWSIPKTSRH